MILKIVLPFAWTCWIILLGTLVVATVIAAKDTRTTPEVGPEFGYLVFAGLYLLLIIAGGLLYWFTTSELGAGILTMAAVLGFAVAVLIVPPVVRAYEQWSFERDLARVGDFEDPALQALAEAIRAGDHAALTRRLDGKPPPPGRDRDGHDLFGYALVAFRDRKGSLDCVRVLLEAGCDPRAACMPDGLAPIHFMIVDITPRGREAVLLLLKHGADPNAVDPNHGTTPIREAGDHPELVRALVEAGAEIDRIQPSGVTALVEFVGRLRWESACYLVEQGARLDVANEDGLSLDYYLESWKDDVFGEHPEGWDRVRAALAARGKHPPEQNR